MERTLGTHLDAAGEGRGVCPEEATPAVPRGWSVARNPAVLMLSSFCRSSSLSPGSDQATRGSPRLRFPLGEPQFTGVVLWKGALFSFLKGDPWPDGHTLTQAAEGMGL